MQKSFVYSLENYFRYLFLSGFFLFLVTSVIITVVLKILSISGMCNRTLRFPKNIPYTNVLKNDMPYVTTFFIFLMYFK